MIPTSQDEYRFHPDDFPAVWQAVGEEYRKACALGRSFMETLQVLRDLTREHEEALGLDDPMKLAEGLMAGLCDEPSVLDLSSAHEAAKRLVAKWGPMISEAGSGDERQ